MILSPDNLEIAKLKYRAGDKFLLKKDSLTTQNYSKNMKGALSAEQVIVEIDSYELNPMGDIGYRVQFLNSELEWRWFITPDILDEDFVYLGRDWEKARFHLLED